MKGTFHCAELCGLHTRILTKTRWRSVDCRTFLHIARRAANSRPMYRKRDATRSARRHWSLMHRVPPPPTEFVMHATPKISQNIFVR